MPIVYLATCADLPDGDDEDGAALASACGRVGLDATWQVWDDPTVDWTRADLVVVRATWDYTARLDQFLAWTRAVPRLANPATVLRWNSDKRYLDDLHRAGIPIVPTAWSEPGGPPPELPTVGEFVIKPAVAAGSRGAARFSAEDPDTAARASAHIASLHAAGRTVMLQPYLADVDATGETALIYLGGEYSHSIRKAAMLTESVVNPVDGPALYVPEQISPRTPEPSQRALADRVLAAAPDDLLYARVDLLPTPGGPVLIELELTEPSLFLDYGVEAADRLARAVAGRLS